MLKIGIECESIESPESWGIGRIVKKLLEEISGRPELAKEFKFFLYFKSRIPDLPYLENRIFIKKIIGVPSFSLYYYLFLPAKLWFEKLDATFFPNYMLPIIFRGKSIVMLSEDIYHEMRRNDLPLRYKLAYKIFAGWWAARHATKIMAMSETSGRELAKLFGIKPERIVVNQLGVGSPKKISDIGHHIFDKEYILYVGQAFPRRHLKETMLAFEMIAPRFSDLKLVAIGYDKYNPPIIKGLAEDINKRLGEDRVVYKEYVDEDELGVLYSDAKLLVYVSSREAFGLPPLEALSYGLPAAVADQPVTREIFGDSAFFAKDPDSSESIAKAISEGLTDEQKRQKIKESAPRILKEYSWRGFTDRFIGFVANRGLFRG